MNGKYILQHYKLQKRKVNLFTGYRYPIILKFCDLIVFCVFYTVNGLDHNFGAEICTKTESMDGNGEELIPVFPFTFLFTMIKMTLLTKTKQNPCETALFKTP